MKKIDSAIWKNEDEHGDWMVEFVPCQKGPNFSDANFIDLIERWNKKIDKENFDVLMAVSLVPVSTNQDYDMLWQQEFWTKDRDKFWKDWKENHEAKWNDENSSVLCSDTDNILDYKASIRGKILPFDERMYFQEFRYCNYKEGCNESDLLAFEESYYREIKQLGIKGSCLSALFRPLSNHAKNTFDFVWHNCFDTLENHNITIQVLNNSMCDFVTFDSVSHTASKIR
tara:strand:+ start:253 stop:936 length:684 start_codon:yes stop_codon:yes gene_type:complete